MRIYAWAEITTLDVVRADKFVHEMTGAPMTDVSVPVIGAWAEAIQKIGYFCPGLKIGNPKKDGLTWLDLVQHQTTTQFMVR